MAPRAHPPHRPSLLRYWRVWHRCLMIAVARELEYRFNFVASILNGLAQVGLAIVTILVLYSYTDSLAGWTREQVLMLVGVYRVVEGLLAFAITRNMWLMGDYIRHGELDFFLLRPLSSQFLVSTRRIALAEIVNVAIGLGIAVYAGSLAGVAWAPLAVAEALAFLAVGLVLLYCVWFAIVTTLFWSQATTLGGLFPVLLEMGRYPVAFFSDAIRALLTFVFPIAFATTFPVEALLGRADHRLLAVGLVLATLGLLGTNLFWNVALRRYTSANG